MQSERIKIVTILLIARKNDYTVFSIKLSENYQNFFKLPKFQFSFLPNDILQNSLASHMD